MARVGRRGGCCTSAGLSTAASWWQDGEQANAGFGHSVSAAGDVNADGFLDVLVGAFEQDGAAGLNSGKAFLYLGSGTGLSPSVSWSAEGEQAGASFGSAVSGAGDVDGDGFSDVAVGASKHDGSAGVDSGKAYVYLGSSAGLSPTAAWSVEGEQAGAQLGYSASGAADVNGDGFSDVVVGAPFHNGAAGSRFG